MAEVKASWRVELNCDCPACGEYVDLLSGDGFWDGRKLDIPEHDTDNSRDMEVCCPECGHEFKVDCEW